MYFIFSKYNKFSHFHSRFSRIWFQPIFFVVVQLLNQVQLFSTPWTVAHQASLSFITSQSLLKLMFIESVMPSNHLVPCVPSSSCLQSFPASGFFSWVGPSHQVAKALELQFQHQSFQWIFRVNFLQNWLVWCPCSQGESPAPRFESINSLALKLPYGPALSLTHTCCVEQTAEELSGWQSDSVNLWLPQQAIYPFCASVSSLVKWE